MSDMFRAAAADSCLDATRLLSPLLASEVTSASFQGRPEGKVVFLPNEQFNPISRRFRFVSESLAAAIMSTSFAHTFHSAMTS